MPTAQSCAVENISTGSRGFAGRFTVAACILNEGGALALAPGERFKIVRYISRWNGKQRWDIALWKSKAHLGLSIILI